MTSYSDRELVARAQGGCQVAFGELFERHYKACVKLATFMLSDPAEALDEVQKACCKAFVHLNQYQGQAEFRTWMLRIVENQCRMLLRSRRRARTLHLDTDTDPAVFEMASPGTGPEEEVISRELRERLQTEINRIPRLLRTVLQLRDVQELPLANVAEQLNISLSAAKSRLVRARLALKARVMRRSENG